MANGLVLRDKRNLQKIGFGRLHPSCRASADDCKGQNPLFEMRSLPGEDRLLTAWVSCAFAAVYSTLRERQLCALCREQERATSASRPCLP
jgi:hypothetical protein